MTAIQGVHPYADKFPMLPDGEHRLFGISTNPMHTVSILESDTSPGFYDVDITSGCELVSSIRPMNDRDFINAFIRREIGSASIKWERRKIDKSLQLAPENIYFISDEDGYIKIGFARNVQSRLETLQTASRQELRVVATIPGSLSDEKSLHHKFAKDHVRGEWFRPSHELKQYIKESA